MVGIPGAGKSFFAEHFAKTFQAPLVSDAHLIDATSPDHLLAIRDYFLGELFKTKRTIILETATAETQTGRRALTRLARQAGYDTLLVWVQTETHTAEGRAIKYAHYQPDEFQKAIKHFSPPSGDQKLVVISGRHTYPSQLKIVLSRLSNTTAPKPHTREAIEPTGRPRRNLKIQ